MSPQLTVANIRQLINKCVEKWRPMVESKGILLTAFIEDSLYDNRVIDSKQLRACLNTLLSNAAHYTETGRIHIHVTANESPQNEPQDLKIIILDTGKGMSETEQTELLKPDSGSRLSHTKVLAQTMGGDLEIISNSGRGSEFILTCQSNTVESFDIETSNPIETVNELVDLHIDDDDEIPIYATSIPNAVPLLEPNDRTNKKPVDFDPDNLRGLKVMIVDDIPSNHDVIKIFLTPEGCQCICLDTGEGAIETLITQKVDIILMDVRMPGMDGIETTREIRYRGLDIPIIALTADGSAQANAACMAAGADLFLTKPVLRRDLIESIRFVRRYKNEEIEHINVA